MLSFTDYMLIFLLGSFGGFLSGFLGVGGGIVYVPILDYFLSKLGFTGDALVKAILANSLFTIIFSGSLSSYKQYKMGNFYPREIWYTASTGVISAVIMTLLIRFGTWYDRMLFNYVFAVMLFVIAFRMFTAKPRRSVLPGKEAGETISKKGYAATGLLTGIVTAMSGLGGGAVMTPVFTDVLKQDIKKASSISNGVIPFLAVAVGILNLTGKIPAGINVAHIGYIVFPVVAPMIVASVFFAPLGVSISRKVDHSVIRSTFAFFISIVFIKTLYAIWSSY